MYIYTCMYICMLYTDGTSIYTSQFSQKQLPRKMKSRLVILECAGYILWQLFLRLLWYNILYTIINILCPGDILERLWRYFLILPVHEPSPEEWTGIFFPVVFNWLSDFTNPKLSFRAFLASVYLVPHFP